MKTNQLLSFDRIFGAVATVAVVAGVIGGFWVLGTPGRQRDIAADRQRLQDLQSIAFELYGRSQNQPNFELPTELDTNQRREDPITNQPYGYERLSASRYELCAEFSTDSSTYPLQSTNQEDEFWMHPNGLYCFEFEINEQPPSFY
ncbi:hypothetical protein C7271_07870 [filamentous cyanobacterium CCP5]|nr:hypothetical protein C7271_07870 [filamentous cyanobacterium CCP5]